MHQVAIQNTTHPFSTAPILAGYCDRFFCRLLGLMQRPDLPEFRGLLLVEPRESKINAAIHMLFMRFDIAVIWIDSDLRVVDVRLARRWHLSYTPARPARYTLETRPEYLQFFQPDDQLTFTL